MMHPRALGGIGICALLLMAAAWVMAQAPAAEPNLVLGRPTDRSITLSVLAAEALDAFVEFGAAQGAYTGKTSPLAVKPGAPAEILIEGLKPNTRYYYRLLWRSARRSIAQGFPPSSFPHRFFKSGRIMCELDRTDHILATMREPAIDIRIASVP